MTQTQVPTQTSPEHTSPRADRRPGFATTAAYFEALAKRARNDDDRKQRLLEVAGFYRSLARIVPSIPNECRVKGAAAPFGRAERWRARAEECRTLADHFTDPTCRLQLADLAHGYELMAQSAE